MSANRLRIGSLAIVAGLLASLMVAGGTASASTACAAATTEGCWSKPFSPFGEFDNAAPQTPAESQKYPAAASAVVLPDGRIVYWNGLQDLENAQAPIAADAGGVNPRSKTAILDLTGSSPLFFLDTSAPAGDDLFCADQRLNGKGQLLTAGGTNWETEIPAPDGSPARGLAELYGSLNTHKLVSTASTPSTDTVGSATSWSLTGNMNFRRWYPSMLTLPSGNEFIAGGVAKLLWNSQALDQRATDMSPYNVKQSEIRDINTGAWTQNPAASDTSLPLFARLHLLPNGKIFYGGAGQMWGPAGESMDQTDWNNQKVLDPSNLGGGWTTVGTPTFGARSGTFSTMLPLRPNSSGVYDKAQILMGGGVLGTAPGTYVSTNFSELVTVAKSGSDWTYSNARTADMNNRRWYSSAVALPNGQVVAVSGADADEVVMPGPEGPVHQAELWNGSAWVPLASGLRDRTYHNSAILLPDGSVLVGGHAPINRYYGATGAPNNEAPGRANNLKDPSFERLFPPYLYNGTRPKVLTAQPHATWGGSITLALDPSSVTPDTYVLTRMPAVTHTTDADARTVQVTATQTGTAVSLSVPSDRNVLPPGFYYVFALKGGTPSVATIVQIADPADYDGRVVAAPINIADTPLRTSSSAAVTGVRVPVSAAKHAPVQSTSNDVVATAPERISLPAGSRAASPAPWLFAIAALMGAVLVRRARTARSRA